MPTPEAMSTFAEKIAGKLGLTVNPHVVWASPECRKEIGNRHAHAHCYPGRQSYGQICMKRGNASLSTVRRWHALLAHEVTHFKVKDHGSIAFAKWLVKLGYPSMDSAQARVQLAAARGGKRHAHRWAIAWQGNRTPTRHCVLCKRNQVGTITWKDKKEDVDRVRAAMDAVPQTIDQRKEAQQ